MIPLTRLVAVILLCPLIVPAQVLDYTRDASGISISEDGQPVLHYQTQPTSLDGKYSRANYIHPLYSPQGEIVTEDFPGDHLHHRGIFWAWHQVLVDGRPMGDSWECRDFSWDIDNVEVVAADTSLTISSLVFWKSPALLATDGTQRPLVKEQTQIRIYQRIADMRVLDFEISLLALVPNLRLGGSTDEKGYGGFSVRMKLPANIRFFSESGRVYPQENAVRAGSWMNISAPAVAGGSNGGVLVFDGNRHGNHGTSWIIRDKGSMQNAVFPGRTPVPISMETPTILRYRLVVYDGELSPEQIATLKPSW